MKQHTAPTHARVESALDLLDPALTPHRLRAVLERFHGFWSGNEPVIDAWSIESCALAEMLEWPRRRRTERLADDVALLGGTAGELPVAPPVFAPATDAEVLGWLYVSEGSTLGGALIERRLRAMTHELGIRLTSFTPYDEGPGPMWQSYVGVAEHWAGADEARVQDVARAAAATFDALEAWLAPVGVEVAA